MSAISTDELCKSFGDHTAVDELTLSVDTGECYGLLGPNGAGKTTAIELLTGQLAPDDGTARVLGRDPAADPVGVREVIGVLPEKESPPSFLTPREFFQFVGRVRGIDPDRLEQQVTRWSGRLGLCEHLDTLAADLSRGNQQKAMIAAAFLHGPDAVFIDEPLANLDPIVQERVKEALVEYAEKHAVVLSTHHVEVAAEICTTVGIVNDGRLVAERDPSALDPDESLLTAFLDVVEDGHAAAGEQRAHRPAGGSEPIDGGSNRSSTSESPASPVGGAGSSGSTAAGREE